MKHLLLAAAVMLWSAGTVRAVDPGLRCESSKLKTAGKYGFCRLTAESKAVKTATTPDFSKCEEKFSYNWQLAETNGGGICPSNGDESALQAFITQHNLAGEVYDIVPRVVPNQRHP